MRDEESGKRCDINDVIETLLWHFANVRLDMQLAQQKKAIKTTQKFPHNFPSSNNYCIFFHKLKAPSIFFNLLPFIFPLAKRVFC